MVDFSILAQLGAGENIRKSEPDQNSAALHEVNPAVMKAAEDFEAAFISQMLKFSGLTEALTTGGGEDVSAFTDFYIDSFAQKIMETGSFGLKEKFYQKLLAMSDGAKANGGLNVQS